MEDLERPRGILGRSQGGVLGGPGGSLGVHGGSSGVLGSFGRSLDFNLWVYLGACIVLLSFLTVIIHSKVLVTLVSFYLGMVSVFAENHTAVKQSKAQKLQYSSNVIHIIILSS